MSDNPKYAHAGARGRGRVKGVPNKATADSRAAIVAFVEGNVPRLNRLLAKVENGVKRRRKRHANQHDDNGYIVEPNPGRAFELIQSLIEYHVPKLQRVGPDGKPPPGPSTSVVILGPEAAAVIAKSLAAEV